MDKQELLDYLNNNLVEYDNLITSKENLKINIDLTIASLTLNIADLEDQKVQADADIAVYNVSKGLVDQIIVVVEAS
jgi:hypothetical protein